MIEERLNQDGVVPQDEPERNETNEKADDHATVEQPDGTEADRPLPTEEGRTPST